MLQEELMDASSTKVLHVECLKCMKGKFFILQITNICKNAIFPGFQNFKYSAKTAAIQVFILSMLLTHKGN
jgi:hypothetical protein